jgi:transposase, IS5 family
MTLRPTVILWRELASIDPTLRQATLFLELLSLVLRQFCRIYLEKVPDDTTLIRWANPIGPETLQQLKDRVVPLARGPKVTRGRTLRVDTTAVPTNLPYPTDSVLLGDGVRVLSRRLRRAKEAPGTAAAELGEAFRSRVRAVRRLSQPVHRIARRKGDGGRAALKTAYGRLIEVAQRTGSQARRVQQALQQCSNRPRPGHGAGSTRSVPSCPG